MEVTNANTAHRHDGRKCTHGIYFTGDMDDPKPTLCPDLEEDEPKVAPVKPERPMCQHPGCINRATTIVAWTANSYFKVFCDAHANRRPKGYYVGRLVGFE